VIVRLRGLIGEFELRHRWLAAPDTEPLRLDRWQVVRLLRSALAEVPAHRWRALLDEGDPERSLDDVVERVAHRIARGELVLVPIVHAAASGDRDEPEEDEDEDEPPPEQEEPEEEPPTKKTTIRVSLFFDGTANNRANTRARELGSQAYLDNDDEISYQNDYSNVSRLETLCLGDDTFEHSFSIYVEGIGTTNGDSDTTYGLALGMGATGVKAKVERGVNAVLRRIRQLPIEGKIIERIHLDAFGFSRGGAAARYFVHFVLDENPLKPRIEGLGHTVELLEINFIGLFDTVASYGVVHSNDTADLSLDAIQAAKKVLQLAAAEEHRKNFRLTNIASAVGKGIGTEIYLPGVHSDIGGGYTNPSTEEGLQILDFDGFSNDAMEQRFAREREWLIATGWYLPNEIAAVNFWNELKITKRVISNEYNRIPLRHMADFAITTGLTFEPVPEHYPVPSPLATIDGLIASYVAMHTPGATSQAADWIDARGPEFQHLRHGYLHFSAYYGSTMGANAPQWSAGGAMAGVRQRIVQDG
jgi:hypothetical protein